MSSGYDDGYDDRPDSPAGRPDRAALARQRVGVPGLFLLLNGLAGLVVAVVLFVVSVVAPEIMVDAFKQAVANQPPGPEKQKQEQQIQDLENQLQQDRVTRAVVNSIELGVFAVLNLVAVYGAIRMRSVGSYGWGVAASVVSLIPCTTGCCCTGPPFGLWGLLVLMDAGVKAGFAAARSARAPQDGY